MVVCCAVISCHVDSRKDKDGMFSFPKDYNYRKQWIECVNRESKGKPLVPNHYSRLCARHFENFCFEINPDIAAENGIVIKRLRLKTDAIPTLHLSKEVLRKRPSSAPSGQHSKQKILKTEVQPVVEDIIDTPHSPQYTAVPVSLPTVHTSSMSTVTSTTTYTSTMVTPSTVSVVTRAQTPTLSPLAWFADVVVEQPKIPSSRTTHTSTEPREPTPSPTPTVFNVQCQTPYNLMPKRTICVQTDEQTRVDSGTQTDPVEISPMLKLPRLNKSIDDSFMSEASTFDKRDEEWLPDTSTMSDTSVCSDSVNEFNEAKERKYIVFESNLEALMKKCSSCGMNVDLTSTFMGSCVTYTMLCLNCEAESTWSSQPVSGTMPFGNLILAGAIMFAGCSANQCLRMLEFCGINTISLSTYYSIQSAYLTPTILDVWELQQSRLINQLKNSGESLKLGGDARCCSPGHTAKFGTYSVMDLSSGKVIDIQLVQSNEVKNSYAMELEGLRRSLHFLMEENELVISDFVTDRHSSVKKFFKDEHPDILHWFDVWHVAKGVYKKLELAGKKKGCEKVKAWARSVSNHLYWCASSSDGDGDLVQQKWFSILNHVINIHEGHGDLYPACQHGDLLDRDWMLKDYKPYAELEKVVMGRLLKQDVKKLSPAQQTSELECFHKVVCSFAPKFVHYFHAQMQARNCLAALHFNENSRRQQATTKDGTPRYAISYPKAKRGEPIAKEVKVKATFEYVDQLMTELLFRREVNKSYAQANAARAREGIQRPNPIAHSTPGKRLNKTTIINEHKSRFNR